MKKLIIFIAAVLILILILMLTTDFSFSARMKFSVQRLSNKEFKSISTELIENPQKDDFRKLVVYLRTKNKQRNIPVEISYPTAQELSEKLGSDICMKATSLTKNDIAENYAVVDEEVIFYTKNLSNEEIKEKLKDLKVAYSYKLGSSHYSGVGLISNGLTFE